MKRIIRKLLPMAVEWLATSLSAGVAVVFLSATLAFPSLAEISTEGTAGWQVWFTDAGHLEELMEPRSGTVAPGTQIYVAFPGEIIHDGWYWRTEETPGLRTVNGPGTDIFYIVYQRTEPLPKEENPDREAREVLDGWLTKAREAECAFTGKSPSQISDESIICASDGQARLRLITAAGAITGTGNHEVYVIAKNMIPSGVCLKEAFGAAIVYSNRTMETIRIGEDTYTVHRFGIERKYGDICSHRYETVTEAVPTCITRGLTRYRCRDCGDEQTVYYSAAGHTDAGGDGVCDVCGKSTDTPMKDFHWYVGDTLIEKVGDAAYTFRCIDEDYSDYEGNHTGTALFLCDTVISAGLDGAYREEDDGTGHKNYVWRPGPIATFGSTNSYRNSNIRAFLDANEPVNAVSTQLGVSSACTGATEEGKFSRLTDKGLTTTEIGFQYLTGKYFILSVPEAFKYRQYLFRFSGSSTDNPQTVQNGTCSGYWLRTPFGGKNDYDETGQAYMVDLEKGNIHPADVRPRTETGDPYIDSQLTVGIRPAFLITNK